MNKRAGEGPIWHGMQMIRSTQQSNLAGVAWSSILILTFIVLIVSHVPWPLNGDQGLYLYGAKELSEGAVLYKDFWDLKSPGVYLFYLAAGSIFGFTAAGLHLSEAIWLGLAGLFAFLIARRATSNTWIAQIAPLLTVGAYFRAATPWHLTQPDGLAVLPLIIGAWALCDRARTGALPLWRFVLLGATAGVAAIFVTSMLLVPLSFLLVFIVFGRYMETATSVRSSLRCVLAVLAGFCVPIGVLFLWFLYQGASEEILWTILSYPIAARDAFEFKTGKLVHSVTWFYSVSACLLPAVAVGVVVTLQGVVRKDAKALFGLLMLVWLAFGGLALLLQYHYSWEFHFNPFFVPIGILAVLGLDEVVRQFRVESSKAVCAAVLLVTLIFPALALVKIARVHSFDDETGAYQDSAQIGLSDALPDDSVYVFGDPRLLLASGRKQAVAHNGWALEVMVNQQWASFSEALRSAEPSYLYLGSSYPALLELKAPEIKAWIDTNYDAVFTDIFGGTWLRQRTKTGPINIPQATFGSFLPSLTTSDETSLAEASFAEIRYHYAR